MKVNATKVKNLSSSITGTIPTVPTVVDHTQPGWINETDIYEGELFINTADATMFTRAGTQIIQLVSLGVTGGTATSGLVIEPGIGLLSGQQVGTTASATGAYSIALGVGTIASGTASYTEGYLNMESSKEFSSRVFLPSGPTSTDTFSISGDVTSYFPNGQKIYIQVCTESSDVPVFLESIETTVGSSTFDSVNTILTLDEIITLTLSPTAFTRVSIVTNIANSIIKGSHLEGINTTTGNCYASHAEGFRTSVTGNASHAEGYGTTASGNSSHAEGKETIASGLDSHAEGYRTVAANKYAHAEGYGTTAGEAGHAEGAGAYAYLYGMHAKKSYLEQWGSYDRNAGQYGNVTVFGYTNDGTTKKRASINGSYDNFPNPVPKRITIPNNTIFNFRVLGVGTDSLGNCAAYNITGIAKNIGGTGSHSGITVTEIQDDFGIVGMSAEVEEIYSGPALCITAIGASATTINWSAFVEWQEFTFA